MAKVEDRERWSDTEVLNVPQVNAELRETVGEMNGRIDREKMLSISGRSRRPQISLAAHFGLHDYPCPAGGCTSS